MSVLGLIDGVGESVVSLSQAVSGYISDRIKKRKIFIWLGYFFGGLSRLGYSISTNWPQVIPFRILDRAGKIRSAPRDAIVADLSDHSNRGRNFGYLRAADNLGAVVGIVITLFAIQFLNIKTIFLIASIPSFIGVILILFFINERHENHIKIFKGIKFSDLSSNFRLFIFLSAIFSLATFSYSFLLIYARESGFIIPALPFLYLIFTVTASLFSIPAGSLSDKIGRKNLMIVSFLFWILVCIIFLTSHNFILIILGFIVYGLHRATQDTVEKAFVAELSPTQFRASSLGGFQMITGLCALPSSAMAGILWDKVGITTPLYFSIFLSVIAISLLFFVKESKK